MTAGPAELGNDFAPVLWRGAALRILVAPDAVATLTVEVAIVGMTAGAGDIAVAGVVEAALVALAGHRAACVLVKAGV